VLEDDRVAAGVVLIERDAVLCPLQQFRQGALALLDGHPTQVGAVKLKQVERAQ
jgi:hypothetical protein